MTLSTRQKRFLKQTTEYIRNHFENECTGHDWWHIYRVKNTALKIVEKESGDLFKVEMAALLHDLDDWKLNGRSEDRKTEKWMKELGLHENEANEIMEIIEQVSFKGEGVENVAETIEAKIVQDADRLDAIGAIGIARTFAYGGSKGRLIHHPAVKPVFHKEFETYKNNDSPTINHFYEKLLLLKERLNTETAKRMAETRHLFMEKFLEQFYAEWDGE